MTPFHTVFLTSGLVLALCDGAQAQETPVNHAPASKPSLTLQMPAIPDQNPIDRNHGIYRERDSQGVEKSHIFAWTRPPRVMEALR
jgi:hypothetical protein